MSDNIELAIGNVDTELAACPPVNPSLIESVIMEAKDRFDVRVLAIAGCDTKPTLVGARRDVIVDEAGTIGWGERRSLEVLNFGRI